MVSDEQVDSALEFLRTSAPKAAVARSQAKTLEKYLGVVEAKAKSMASGDGLSNAAAQDWARGTEDYKTALDAWQESVRQDAEFTMLREAAQSRILAWQTWSANNRTMERVR